MCSGIGGTLSPAHNRGYALEIPKCACRNEPLPMIGLNWAEFTIGPQHIHVHVYPLFRAGESIPSISEHIPRITPHITGSVSIKLKCVPFSKTPNFNTDHTP